MGADSFGARADPTTDQLKWKKVQCYMSHARYAIIMSPPKTGDWKA